ncbi:MAG TPA: DUF4396 domain-containing protein [Terracidiphilus sp.]
MTLTLLAWISLAAAFASAFVILIDEIRHPQKMAVMNIVWPISALYFSLFALWAYFRIGRSNTKAAMAKGMSKGKSDRDGPPTLTQVAIGTSHCGAGCTIADVFTEFGIAAAGLTLFGSVLWTEYLLDFVVAWAFGIAFQYFAIKPMRDDLSPAGAIWAAIKADTFSIAAFQIGMYAWMALVFFRFFPAPHLTPFDPRYWLMMQIAMLCGFLTSFPMNRLLIGIGLKERM